MTWRVAAVAVVVMCVERSSHCSEVWGSICCSCGNQALHEQHAAQAAHVCAVPCISPQFEFRAAEIQKVHGQKAKLEPLTGGPRVGGSWAGVCTKLPKTGLHPYP